MIDRARFREIVHAAGAIAPWHEDPSLGGRLDPHILPVELERMAEDRVRATIGRPYTLADALKDVFARAFAAGLLAGELDAEEVAGRADEQLLVDFLAYLYRDGAQPANETEAAFVERQERHLRATGFLDVVQAFRESRR